VQGVLLEEEEEEEVVIVGRRLSLQKLESVAVMRQMLRIL
jgi:hypothetical protein